MSHFQQLRFVEEVKSSLPRYFEKKKVLEVGSWDVNGSIRGFFNDCDYLGADVSEGNGVDIVTPGQDLDMPDSTFDVTISCECFEHNPAWKETFVNMVRMLKPNGLCVISCATLGRREHGTSRTNPDASLSTMVGHRDYYHNLRPIDFARAFNHGAIFSEHFFVLNVYSKDLYFIGIKKSTDLQEQTPIPSDLIRRVKAIRKIKHVRLLSRAKYFIRFHMKYFYAILLGEDKFHDLRYRPSK